MKITILENMTDRVGRKYNANTIIEQAKNHQVMGIIGIDDAPGLPLDRISHTVENLRVEGEKLVGDAKILETPAGEILKSLVVAGIEFDGSISGVGTVDGNYVVTDYQLRSINLVVRKERT